MPTVRVRRTPSGLCCLEWVSFYGGWCGLRESGFCRMGPHGALHAGGLSGTPAALSVGNGPPDSQFACLARHRLHSKERARDDRWYECEMNGERPASGLPSV